MTKIFGRLTTTGAEEKRGTSRYLQVSCTCGTVKFVHAGSLRSGSTKSCGCLSREGTRTTHGHWGGGRPTQAWRAWSNMRTRCSNTNNQHYADYGGRGIAYDPEWSEFENFLRDMGEPPPGLSLDRKDNNLGYCKANCRWATAKDQANNRRSNVRIEYAGKAYRLQEIADTLGVTYGAVLQRYHSRWTPEQLVRGYQQS